jgi:TonB family protein
MSFADENDLFSVIPDRRPPLKEFVFSMGVQAVLLVLVAWIAILHPEVITQPIRKIQVTQLVSTPPAVNLTPAPVKVFKTEPVPVPVPEPVVAPRPEALKLPAEVRHTAPKEEVQQAPKIEVAVNKPLQMAPTNVVIPKQLVKTDTFSTGSSATPTIAAAPKNVQTGGFGDPNGVPARDNDNGKPATIAAKGSFDLPSGPGMGNGTGGANGKAGVVASAGFGNGVATGDGSGRTNGSRGNGNVRQAGFGDTEPVAAVAKAKAAEPAVPRTVPAQVLSKPIPLYTEEARKMKIEGEVLLEVVFESGGKVHVNKVIRGLGHGLDEAAIRAAEEIHFKPAMRDGQPSDSTAVLHIVFQLA